MNPNTMSNIKTFEIVENKIELKFPEDIYIIESECRESFYYLSSLKPFLVEFIAFQDIFNKDKHHSLINMLNELEAEYNSLDNRLYNNKDNILPDGRRGLDIFLFWNCFLSYISLREKIDSLQVEILKYLFDNNNILTERLSHKTEAEKNILSQYTIEYHMYLAFNKSKDDDKFNNYRIIINTKFKNELKDKINTKENYRLKIRDYSSQINIWRELLKMSKYNQGKFMTDSSQIREQESLNEISTEQYKLNTSIKKLTFFTVIIALISLIFGCINAYYLIVDHMK